MDTLREWWHVGIGVATGLMWLIRLEARALRNEAEIARLWSQRKEDLESARAQRSETLAMLAEIRADLKALLARKGD